MKSDGHEEAGHNGHLDSRARYILFTGKVKHGHLLRYLLAAQARKRLLETYNLHRQVKSSALTGDPDRLFEVYYAEEPDRLHRKPGQPLSVDTLKAIMDDDDANRYQAIHDALDAERLPAHEIMTPGRPEIPYMQTLLQLPYLLTNKSQQEIAEEMATAPYLLNDVCILKRSEDEDEEEEDLRSKVLLFCDYMSKIIPTFASSGLSLIVAGRFEEHPDRILNIWQLTNLEQHKQLMLRLADNRVYCEIDKLCDQDQHLCRNVSRYYQNQPFLMTA